MSHHEDLHHGPIVADLDEAAINELRILAQGVSVVSESFRSGNVGMDLSDRRELRDRIVEDLYLGQIRGKLRSIGIGDGVDVALRDSLPEGVNALGNGQMQDWPVALIAREGFSVTTEVTRPQTTEQGLRFTVVRQAPPASPAQG